LQFLRCGALITPGAKIRPGHFTSQSLIRRQLGLIYAEF